MVIRGSDRVSAVLAHDETLIDVFVSLSPAFERLRNPRMREVMSRLVTVEQAARLAGVDPDALVDRLNGREASGAGASSLSIAENGSASTAAMSRARPAALAAIRASHTVIVDVREDLLNGREPFSRIMAARREVRPGGALCVRAIFEPVPLYAVMAKQGLTHHTERLADDDWQVWFFESGEAKGPEPKVEAVDGATAAGSSPLPEGADDAARREGEAGPVLILDVRDLEPPEPMERTLAALESLPAGGTLVQLNARVPRFLLPRLEERGFRYEIREQRPDLVRVIIHRADEPRAIRTETDRGVDVHD